MSESERNALNEATRLRESARQTHAIAQAAYNRLWGEIQERYQFPALVTYNNATGDVFAGDVKNG